MGLGPGQHRQAEKTVLLSLQDAHQCDFALLFPFSFPFSAAAMHRAVQQKTFLEIALKKKTAIFHQEVASLRRKLESVEKEKEDVLVRLADATKGHFLAMIGPCVNSPKEHLFPV